MNLSGSAGVGTPKVIVSSNRQRDPFTLLKLSCYALLDKELWAAE
jgi:hypothetical protein